MRKIGNLYNLLDNITVSLRYENSSAIPTFMLNGDLLKGLWVERCLPKNLPGYAA